MAGWHHQLHGHEFGWTPGVGDGQGGLACCNSWSRKESDTTEWLNWNELNKSLEAKNWETWAFIGNRNMSKKEESECLLESLNCASLEWANFEWKTEICLIGIWKCCGIEYFIEVEVWPCMITEADLVFCPWGFPGKNTGLGCHCLLHVLFTHGQ